MTALRKDSVSLQGFAGVTAVAVTVAGPQIEHTTQLAGPGADKNWRASLPDVINGDDKETYVIRYTLQDDVHESTGTVRFANADRPEAAGPITRRYLERRATTVFHDDFHSGTIDLTKWTHESNQVNMLTPEPANSFIKHNMLHIKPTLTVDHFGDDFLANGTLDVKAIWGTCVSVDDRGCVVSGPGHIPPVMSARLKTKTSIRYGRITVNARLPKGDWLWPAIWLLPEERHYGNWPKSGEIDIMESRGNLHYHDHRTHQSKGRDYTHAAIHYGSRWDKPHRRFHAGEFWINGTTFTDGFHHFWMDWTADYIRLGVDGHTVMAWDTPSGGYWQEGQLQGDNIWASGGKDAPFDRPFYLILNVSVGGGWFWESMENAPYPQPWESNATKAEQFLQFWKARHLWEPTWHGDDVAMKIRSVTMEQY
ncbi:beta-1,3-glucan-binding protein-like [Babylonia areolata]|uniref:beta-1,3-glucan-binding protein-like n=1 Tax=Babylonia areolata TaxID=304850 RepID=UPI003FD3BAFA